VRKAPVFYAPVAVGTVGGTVLSLVSSNPIQLLVIVAVINGIAAAPILLLVMFIAADPHIMGEYRNGKAAAVLGWSAGRLDGRRPHHGHPVRRTLGTGTSS
jgi:Mn2+/Fe2+ NRAMP family transporter